MKNIKEVVKSIETAFGENDFPSDLALLYDANCTHDECLYIVENFSSRNWENVSVPIGDTRFREDALGFFSREAFVYFTPAFMVWILAEYDDTDVFIGTFFNLLGQEIAKDRDTSLTEEEGVLDVHQIRSIIVFAEYIVEHFKDIEALEFLRFVNELGLNLE